MKFGHEETLPGACGVSCLSNFCSNNHWGDIELNKDFIPAAGTGIVCAGFIYKDPICDQAFKELSEKGVFLYKTKVRKNRNSGHKFYFALFDFAKKGKGKYGFDDLDRQDVRRGW